VEVSVDLGFASFTSSASGATPVMELRFLSAFNKPWQARTDDRDLETSYEPNRHRRHDELRLSFGANVHPFKRFAKP